jgi:ATP-dependent helicase/nuclease subunit B
MNRLTAALADICRQRLLDEKWLIAPSLRVGHQWQQTVARHGQPTLNLHIKTLKSMALELAGPSMTQAKVGFLSSRAGELLIDGILTRLGSDGLEYLGRTRAHVGLVQAIYRSIAHLQLAGLEPGQAAFPLFEVSAKARDLHKVWQEYRRRLQGGGLCDYAAVLRLAVARLREEATSQPDGPLVLVPGDAELHFLERALLRALPADRCVPLPVDEAVDSEPVSSQRQIRTDADRLRWLHVPADAPAPFADGTVQIFRAMGEINEVREVLRRCLASGIPFDDVELLHTDRETYVPLIYETLSALEHAPAVPDGDLPVTFVEGVSCRYSRPGRALLSWLKWLREDYAQATLVNMIREGLLAIAGLEEEGFSFAGLAALLRSIGIGFGRKRYLDKLDRQIRGLEQQMQSPGGVRDEDGATDADRLAARQRVLSEYRMLRALVADLLNHSPLPEADPKQVLASAIQFLDHSARRVSKLDNYAHERLVDEVNDMKRCLEQDADAVTMNIWEWLAAVPNEAQVLGSGPRAGCLHVAPVASGGHSGRGHLFIVGLDDARFPGSGFQDPLLLDNERKRLSAELETAADRLQRSLQSFARLLARQRGVVTLSFCSRDLVDDRDLFPSPVFLAVYRVLSGNPQGDQSDLFRWIGAPESFAPKRVEACLDEREWWLCRLCGAQPVQEAENLVRQRYPHLARGWAARRQRESHEFTAYDGRVEQAGQALDPAGGNGSVLSSRKLERLASCPLKYFFVDGLGLEPPVELRLDLTRWLDALTKGTLLHEVFERFMRELLMRDQLPVHQRDFPRLKEILDERVAVYQDLRPPPSESIFRREYEELLTTGRIFLQEEEALCRREQCRPVYLETALGMRIDRPGTPLDTAEPISVTLANGKTIRVRGRVDRIDRIGDGALQTYAIWDYKSGGAGKYSRSDPFQQGRVMQPALYLAMVGHRLREVVSPQARIVSFGFFFPGTRARGDRLKWTAERLAEGDVVLERLCRLAANGAFLATDNHEVDCSFCDYQGICGDVEAVASASKRKLRNAHNTLLQPFLELRARKMMRGEG